MSNLTITAPRRVLNVTTDSSVLRLSAPGPATLKIVREGIQGPPGTGAEDALLRTNRLSEFDNQAARTQARTNLELETIDLGTFN